MHDVSESDGDERTKCSSCNIQVERKAEEASLELRMRVGKMSSGDETAWRLSTM